jgi:type II secretory pathway pseudopilin PulG
MLAGHPERRCRSAGFSLVELMISLSLVMLLTLALLTSYLFIARGDHSLTNYTVMNAQARSLLEVLGADLRGATDVTNFTPATLSLVLPSAPGATGGADVVWTYDAAAATLTRRAGGNSRVYARDIESLDFSYYNVLNTATTSLVEVKQVQLNLRMVKLVASAKTSEYVISAQFTMRAKSTSN